MAPKPPKQGSQRQDEKSIQKRDSMRELAKAVQRMAASHGTGTAAERLDSWKNQITALGITGRDKRLGGSFSTERLVDLYAEDIWRGDDMAGRAIEAMPDEVVRAGWKTIVQIVEEDKKPKPTSLGDRPKFEPGKPKPGEKAAPELKPGEKAEPQKGFPPKKKDGLADVFPEGGVDTSGKDTAEAMDKLIKEIDLINVIGQAMKAERGYGGAALFPGIVDGEKDLSKPLNYARIRSIDWVDVLTPVELIPFQWYNNPVEKDYGKPEIYWMQRIAAGNIGSTPRIPIHESRLIVFPGIVISRRQLREHWGWGDSILVRMMEVLRDFQSTWGGAAILMQEYSRLIISIKGLSESFASGESNLLVERARAFADGLSIANAGIIDSEETAERQGTPISGMPEMLDRFCNRLAAAARTPVTILMGQAPAGLNATGDADIRSYYDHIASYRERSLLPRVERLYRMIWASAEGPSKGREPEKWGIEYGPLWQPTELEEANRRLAVANADNVYLTQGSITPEEIAKSRWGGAKYSAETQLDLELRLAFDQKAEEEAQAQAEQMQAQAEAQASALALKQQSGDKPPFPPKGGTPPPGPGGGKKPPFGGGGKPGGGNPFAKKDEENEDYNPDQPRDEKGRFGSEGSIAAEKELGALRKQKMPDEMPAPLPGGKTKEEHEALAREVVARHEAELPANMAKLTAVAGEHGEVSGRAKEEKSALNKLRRKPDQYGDATKLQDTTGMRVVTKDLESAKAAVASVRANYKVLDESDNLVNARPDGYRSAHFIVETKAGPAEIQVRTENQHKFAEFSHDTYKPQTRAQEAMKNDPETRQYVAKLAQHYFERDSGDRSKTQPAIPPRVKFAFGKPGQTHK